MKNRVRLWLSIAAVMVIVSTLLPVSSVAADTGSLSVGFAGTHLSSGAYTDFTAAVDLTLTGFDLNLVTGSVTVDIYYKAGTATGFTSTPGAWTLLASVPVMGNGQGVATYVAIPGISIAAGETYAVYFYADNQIYNADGPITGASNAHLTIVGAWENHGAPFGGAIYNGWGWQGTAYYSYGEEEGAPGCDVLMYIPSTAVGGRFVSDAAVYWKPGEVTKHVIKAGTSVRVLGKDATGAYYKILYVCDYLWVPVGTLGPNYDAVWNGAPLPTAVVE